AGAAPTAPSRRSCSRTPSPRSSSTTTSPRRASPRRSPPPGPSATAATPRSSASAQRSRPSASASSEAPMSSAAKLPVAPVDPDAEAARLVARVAAVGPRIRERAREAEARGRLTDDVFAALVETGVFRALTPRRWGGLGLGVRCLCDLARTLARFDASAAWVTAFLVEHNWMLCRLGPDHPSASMDLLGPQAPRQRRAQ